MGLLLPALPAHMDIASGALTDEENERLTATMDGLPSSSRECQTCFGTGSFRFYADMVEADYTKRPLAEYDCPCADQFSLQRYLAARGMGKLYARLFWRDASYIGEDTKALILNYTANLQRNVQYGRGLLLEGPSGAGKTMLAALLLKEVLKLGHDGYWTTFVDLLDMHADTWRGSPEVKRWFERRVRSTTLLIVDDIGKEFARREVAVTQIDNIFRARTQAGLPTVFTTNESDEDFARRYSPAMQSLMVEACLRHRVVTKDLGDVRGSISDRNSYEIDRGLSRPFTLGTLVSS